MSRERSPSPEPSLYRVTLFFGPEPVEQRPGEVACVFNVKKRSWKAGIQVSVEIHVDQLATLREQIRLSHKLSRPLSAVDQHERPDYEARAADLFVQAACWCKLDLRLEAGLAQENQRIPANELVPELDHAMAVRAQYAATYILTELDLAMPDQSPSSM
ncbi:MAG: hypothetical protein ICV75_00275 [Nitrospiraceae bacterium]|nr:hypothetical protein [Nitrospiraceae bacterium]